MKISYLFIISFLFLFAVSCIYQPTGDIYFDVAKPDAGDYGLDLNKQGDTINIYGTTSLSLTVTGVPVPVIIYDARAYLDDQQIQVEIKSSTAVIRISPDSIVDKYYLLKVEIISNTGTGSLADAVGSEGIRITRYWILHIDTNPSSPITPNYIGLDSGVLTLKWIRFYEEKIPEVRPG